MPLFFFLNKIKRWDGFEPKLSSLGHFPLSFFPLPSTSMKETVALMSIVHEQALQMNSLALKVMSLP